MMERAQADHENEQGELPEGAVRVGFNIQEAEAAACQVVTDVNAQYAYGITIIPSTTLRCFSKFTEVSCSLLYLITLRTNTRIRSHCTRTYVIFPAASTHAHVLITHVHT